TGRGDGTFGPKTSYGVGTYPESIALADFDRDGRLDIAVTNYYSNSVSVFLNRTTVSVAPATLPARFALALATNPTRGTARVECVAPRSANVSVEVCGLQAASWRRCRMDRSPPAAMRGRGTAPARRPASAWRVSAPPG